MIVNNKKIIPEDNTIIMTKNKSFVSQSFSFNFNNNNKDWGETREKKRIQRLLHES